MEEPKRPPPEVTPIKNSKLHRMFYLSMGWKEQEAILLMKSYCPRHSTPDALVGQYLAKGFVRCLSSFSPPVLTVGGVMRGSEAKLPNRTLILATPCDMSIMKYISDYTRHLKKPVPFGPALINIFI